MSQAQLRDSLSLADIHNTISRELQKHSATGEPVGLNENLFDQGLLDSISLLGFIVRLQKQFDIELTPEQMTPGAFTSLAEITRMVERCLTPS
jgi:acyl carrier protein